ncbi:H4MPT-linked C1 transfer pathway protein [Ramlibacter sp. USB13]|uniref:H4MPT-linked C1 transfer pathway protein n=1 Tax=Ramlibacter cellulosilyticus TaxID=2764187 RepID=A0A923S9Y8_9BURK|nr:hydantoinase/oxoprolinase family protein [Ramlibacter cellulosilyticus]MBC5782230.1 H4MPT-linked C1 transfer pathway protein [Ramlibacter cellulosilyticus]
MSSRETPQLQLGWDIGGAHVKACLLQDGSVRDIAQWPCPLWQGMQHLDTALALARSRWADAWDQGVAHAATMTGELADLFAGRQEGVVRIAGQLAQSLGPSLVLFDAGFAWHAPDEAGPHWRGIASANWCATARVLASRVGDALLVDIGSTTTDLVPLRGGRVAAEGKSDADRLATGELVYQGVVRTPLCALGPRVRWHERMLNVMNELFATTADVYRLTGELAADHDQAATADGRGKDEEATRQRLARMLGCDAADGSPCDWLALARWWKDAQLREIQWNLARVGERAGLPADAPVVGAGSGTFLAAQLAARTGRPFLRYADVVLPVPAADASLASWADVCAPAVSVALLASGRG